jgi:hypothetical protein
MGWMYTHRPRGKSHAQFFSEEFGPRAEILETHAESGVLYMAVRNVETGSVFAAVVLFRWVPKMVYNFGYKDMDETVGPYESNCPDSILSRLTETSYPLAKEWRARCAANNQKRQPFPSIGQRIRTSRPIKVATWQESHSEFVRIQTPEYYKRCRYSFAVADQRNLLVKITPQALRGLGFELIPGDPS